MIVAKCTLKKHIKTATGYRLKKGDNGIAEYIYNGTAYVYFDNIGVIPISVFDIKIELINKE